MSDFKEFVYKQFMFYPLIEEYKEEYFDTTALQKNEWVLKKTMKGVYCIISRQNTEHGNLYTTKHFSNINSANKSLKKNDNVGFNGKEIKTLNVERITVPFGEAKIMFDKVIFDKSNFYLLSLECDKLEDLKFALTKIFKEYKSTVVKSEIHEYLNVNVNLNLKLNHSKTSTKYKKRVELGVVFLEVKKKIKEMKQ